MIFNVSWISRLLPWIKVAGPSTRTRRPFSFSSLSTCKRTGRTLMHVTKSQLLAVTNRFYCVLGSKLFSIQNIVLRSIITVSFHILLETWLLAEIFRHMHIHRLTLPCKWFFLEEYIYLKWLKMPVTDKLPHRFVCGKTSLPQTIDLVLEDNRGRC